MQKILGKRTLSVILTLTLILTMFPLMEVPVKAATAVTDAVELQTALSAGGSIDLGTDITMTDRLLVCENSILNLNGYKLTVTVSDYDGISIVRGKTLTIKDSKYSDKAPGNGKLTVKNTYEGNWGPVKGKGAGINTTYGKLIVESGVIESQSGSGGAGIGGNSGEAGGIIVINGGKITAMGNPALIGGAGIGGGYCNSSGEGKGGTITINNGDVTAVGGVGAAGIGGGRGNEGEGGTITINGGNIKATGDYGGAGIGGGNYGRGGNITINGGTIKAKGSNRGAGIGGGDYRDGDTITINNGTITAEGGSGGGAGIGAGCDGGIIKINGGTIKATGGSGGAGIGGGYGGGLSSGGSGGTVTITGGNVTAIGSDGGTGIGGGAGMSRSSGAYGYESRGADVKISGGTIKASGSYDIGGCGSGGTLVVTGGTIEFAKNGTNVTEPVFKSCTIIGSGAGTYKGTYDSTGKKVTAASPKKTSKPNTTVVPKSKTVKKGTYITLKAPKGTTLYYTTSGKKPTDKVKTKVLPGKTKKIKITKNTTLKVIAKKSGYKVSDVVTRTYKVRK